MTEIRFLVNLNPQTIGEDFRRRVRPWGWLAAPDNTTRATRAVAVHEVAARRAFLADNGNFALLAAVTEPFAARAQALWEEVAAREVALGRSVRAGDVDSAPWRALADEVAQACASTMVDDDAMLRRQLALGPTGVIGVEDITLAAWVRLGLEPAYVRLPRRAYSDRNRAVARRAASMAGAAGSLHLGAYPVASGMSFDTAFDAGVVFARHGLDRVAIGVGALTADLNYVDHLVIRGRRVDLGQRLPARYVRTMAVLAGFLEGYRSAAGRPPEALHCLGLGTPILMALVARAALGVGRLTLDATSPMRDAAEGSLYVSRPAWLRVRARSVALRMATDPAARWGCPCPFCRDFTRAHPFDQAAALAWGGRTRATTVTAADLRGGRPLAKALPLFAEPAGGPLRREINDARIGHNHWIIERATGILRRAADSDRLPMVVDDIVARYRRHAGSPAFAAALTVAHALAEGRSPTPPPG